jgi:hypothetical protein
MYRAPAKNSGPELIVRGRFDFGAWQLLLPLLQLQYLH